MSPRSQVVLATLSAALFGCAGSVSAPEPSWQERSVAEAEAFVDDWTGDDVIAYRLVEKDDFQASSSNSLWGNVAHGAEICTHILPAGDDEDTWEFEAVMRPDCSFWNKVIGPLGRATRLALLAAGVVTIGGGKQPDWYILQHEQVHFAINAVAARKLTAQLETLDEERRTPRLVRRVYEITLEHASARHAKFDGETSGTYDPFLLEKWVRVLEREMQGLCREGQVCDVRIGS